MHETLKFRQNILKFGCLIQLGIWLSPAASGLNSRNLESKEVIRLKICSSSPFLMFLSSTSQLLSDAVVHHLHRCVLRSLDLFAYFSIRR